jgi:hypothetical protein
MVNIDAGARQSRPRHSVRAFRPRLDAPYAPKPDLPLSRALCRRAPQGDRTPSDTSATYRRLSCPASTRDASDDRMRRTMAPDPVAARRHHHHVEKHRGEATQILGAQWTQGGRGLLGELDDGRHDPTPGRRSIVVAGERELVSPLSRSPQSLTRHSA